MQSIGSSYWRLALGVFCSALATSPALALRIQNYSPTTNNRALADKVTPNPDFFANIYDVSGVAINAPAMMLSPHYFVTAAHVAPPTTLQFINRDGQLVTKTNAVMESKRMTNNIGLESDLRICRLYDEMGLTLADSIGWYPIVVKEASPGTVDFSWYAGRELLLFGVDNQDGQLDGLLAGLNTVNYIGGTSFSGGVSPTIVANYRYDNVNQYPNQAGLAGGDSGYGMGLIYEGQLTALGAHMGVFAADANGSYNNVSSFLPYYVDQINDYMALGGTGEQLTLINVPEPTGVAAAFGAIALLLRRRHNAAA